MSPLEQLQCRQALAKQFAHILDFTLRFDEMKMCTPAVQNDFSYYRRTMNRDLMWMQRTDEPQTDAAPATNNDCIVPIDLANTMSFFYADPTPMMAALRRATETFVTANASLPLENTTDMLATMANVCRCMVQMP